MHVEDDDSSEAGLARLAQRAAAAWPALALDPRALEAHLAAILPPLTAGELERLHAPDLGLAAACLLRAPGAAERLLADHGPVVERALREVEGRPEVVEELRQALLVELLVPVRSSERAKLAMYTGRGPLRAWLRMTARRAALNAGRDGARQRLLTDSFAELLHVSRDVELSLIRLRYEADFRDALAAALAALSLEERLVLRLHHIQGLTSSELAVVLKTSRASAHRRVARVRDALQELVRAELERRLGLAPADLEDLLGLLSSRIIMALGVELRERLAPSP